MFQLWSPLFLRHYVNIVGIQHCWPDSRVTIHQQRASHQTLHISFLANDRCLRDYTLSCRSLRYRPNFNKVNV